MKKIIAQLCSITVAILLMAAIVPTAPDSSSNINKPVIDTGQWVFTANQMIPEYGKPSQQGAGYTVNYDTKRLIVSLPYAGKAYSTADMLTGKGPLDFISLSFTVNKQTKRTGEWRISIEPKDNTEVRSMNFIFYSNGSANLDIILTNKSGVSFRGTVK